MQITVLAAFLLTVTLERFAPATLPFAPWLVAAALVAAIFLAYVNCYDHRSAAAISAILGLGLAAWFAALVRRWRRQWALLIVFVLMLLTAYALADVAIVFFAPLAALAQIRRALSGIPTPHALRPTLNALLYLFLAAAVPVVAEAVAFGSLDFGWRAWFAPLTVASAVTSGPKPMLFVPQLALLAAVPAMTIFLLLRPALLRGIRFLWRKSFPRLSAAVEVVRAKPPRAVSAMERRFLHVVALAFLMMAIGGLAALAYNINGPDRRLLAIDYYSATEQWNDLLSAALDLAPVEFQGLPSYDANLALYETNQLADRMFEFPQRGPMLLEFRNDTFLPYMSKLTDMCLRLGRTNDAEHFGYETLSLFGPQPRVIRPLAQVHRVKGDTAAACKFLNVLSYDLVEGPLARQQLSAVASDPTWSRDPAVQLLRRRMQTEDDIATVRKWTDSGTALNQQKMLLNLLDHDKSNRMAFEFLIGMYLLRRDYESAHFQMTRIAGMDAPAYVLPDGRRRTPRHYQEAMLIWAHGDPAIIKTPGVIIDPEIAQAYKDFRKMLYDAKGPQEATKAAEKYAGSYYFYVFSFFGPEDFR